MGHGFGKGGAGSVFSELWDLLRVYRGEGVFAPLGSPSGRGVAVVLGSQVRRGGRPSGTLLARTRHAAGLYERGVAQTLLPTGGLGEHGPSEAEVMAKVLRQGGIPEARIIREDRARNTRESARFVAALAKEEGLEDLILVTDPLHCVRTVGAFRAEGLSVRASPAYRSPMWRIGMLRRGQVAREAVAIVGYRVRRWIENRLHYRR